jgi:hypothetical protein
MGWVTEHPHTELRFCSLTDDTIYIDTSAIDWVVVEVVACTRMASGNE